MIQKLKIKFTALAMTSLFLLLFVLVCGINIINYNSVVRESDRLLEVLSQNKGSFPEMGNNNGLNNGFGEKPDNGMMEKPENDKFPHGFSPEAPYESRFFSVFFNTEGQVVNVDTSKIAAIDEYTAIEYATDILEKGSSRGFLNNYRYMVSADFGGKRITFLNCEMRLDAFYGFLGTSIAISLFGFFLVFIVFSFFSGKIIKPIAEAYEKQKQFITDAGHEMKTPLTIIAANLDILEMELEEENESLADIKTQTKRLKGLTEDLVLLARMEEKDKDIPKIEFPISEVVSEVVNDFKPLAQTKEQELLLDLEPMLSLTGNDKAIRQLLSILLDNALKYTPSKGKIRLSLKKHNNKSLQLVVANTSSNFMNEEQLSHVFDRFYRSDASRNSETGGHGIGLSVAQAIVHAHGGKITAGMKEDNWFTISVLIPL